MGAQCFTGFTLPTVRRRTVHKLTGFTLTYVRCGCTRIYWLFVVTTSGNGTRDYWLYIIALFYSWLPYFSVTPVVTVTSNCTNTTILSISAENTIRSLVFWLHLSLHFLNVAALFFHGLYSPCKSELRLRQSRPEDSEHGLLSWLLCFLWWAKQEWREETRKCTPLCKPVCLSIPLTFIWSIPLPNHWSPYTTLTQPLDMPAIPSIKRAVDEDCRRLPTPNSLIATIGLKWHFC